MSLLVAVTVVRSCASREKLNIEAKKAISKNFVFISISVRFIVDAVTCFNRGAIPITMPIRFIQFRQNLYFGTALFFIGMLLIFTTGCKTTAVPLSFSRVSVDTLLSDKISIRAIVLQNDRVWYGGDHNRFGFVSLTNAAPMHSAVAGADSELRSIAATRKYIFLMNAGSPAILYRVDKTSYSVTECYREIHKDAFYDSLLFDGNQFGIAIGDPIDGCPSVLISKDGGATWSKTNCSDIPASAEGEASFAASNSNIVIAGSSVSFVTGGKNSRLFSSANGGKSWMMYNTPIVHGKQMTGIYSADLLNQRTIVIAGGDYDDQQSNSGNKAITFDGGKAWHLLADGSGPGYISCIQFVPGTEGKGLATVGGSGLHYSSDGGHTWKRLLTDNELYTIRFINPSEAIAAGRNKIIRIRFQ